MLLIDRYHERINQQITKVEQSQRETCMKVGEVMAQCVKNGGCVHVFDTAAAAFYSSRPSSMTWRWRMPFAPGIAAVWIRI